LKIHGYREMEDLNGFLKECERYTKRHTNGNKQDDISLRTSGIQLILAPQQPQPRVDESQSRDFICDMPSTYNNSTLMTQQFPNPYQNL
jgi:hypothetical protein